MNKENNEIENKVMGQIKSGRVKLRSRYVFLAEKLGLGSAFILSVLLAILFFNLVLFYLKASDNLGYLTLGNNGFLAFLESFPYLLIVSVIVLIFIASLIIKQSDFSYKKPFGLITIGLVVFIIVAGIILTTTDVAEKIEEKSYERHSMGGFFDAFLHFGLGERVRGLSGRIVDISDQIITVQTPRSLKKVDIRHLSTPLSEPLSPGLFIVFVGKSDDGVFYAYRLHIASEQDAMMIRRGVNRRFGNFNYRKSK